MKQKQNLRLVIPLMLACATLSAKATVFFNDNFTTGSTTNGISNPNGSSTSYDIASTKGNVGGPVINPGDFTLKLNSATTSAFMECQALFTNAPVTLALPGDFIEMSVTFTNAGSLSWTNSLFTNSTCSLWIGLYDSAGTKPLAGDLAAAGLSTVAGSAFATGNCANWKGYIAQISNGGASRIITRPLQNNGGTSSGNQELLGNNFGGGAFNNPTATAISTTPVGASSISVTPGGVYTVYLKISYAGASSVTFSNALYAGTDTTGTLIYAATNNAFATNATFLTANFDGLAIGTTSKGIATPGGNPILDITHVLISGTVSAAPPPVPTQQPASVTVPLGGSCIFQVQTTGTGQIYQWHRHGTNLNAGGNIAIITSPDSSSSTVLITNVGLADVQSGVNGYWVTVTDPGNLTTNSTMASLALRTSTNLVWNAAGGSTWDLTNTASWRDPNNNTTVFNDGDAVTFDDSIGGGSRAVTLSQTYTTPMSVRFVNDGNLYTVSGSGGIAGSATMFVSGGVQFSEPNTYTGGTTISNDGVVPALVQLGNINGLGTGPLTFAPSAPGSEVELQVAGSASTGLPDVHVNESALIQVDIGTNAFSAVILGGLYGTSGKTLSFEPLVPTLVGNTTRIRVYGTNTTYDGNLAIDGPSVSQALYSGTTFAIYNGSGVETYRGSISGNAGVVQRGSGLSVFAGQNTYSGGTFVTAGGLGIGTNSMGSVSSGPIGTGPLYVTPEVGSATGAGAVFGSGGAWTVANPIEWPSITNNQTLIVGGTNALTFSGTVQLNALDAPTINPTNRTLNVTNQALTTLSGSITDGGVGFGLIKTGNGVLSLAGTGSYASNTVVLAGTLAVNGTLGGSGVFVGTNGVNTNLLFTSYLGGTGSISCPVVISNGAALAPGNSIGTLHVNNSLTLFGNMLIEVNTNLAQNCDQTIVSGALTNAGTGNLIITNIGTSALQTGNRFFVFNKAMSNGAALNILSPGITATWSNGLAVDGSVQILATIPTTPTNITIIASGSTITMSWPSTYLGWSLQSNSVGLLSTNSWFIVPGSSSSTSLIITRDLTKTNVFYRMSLP